MRRAFLAVVLGSGLAACSSGSPALPPGALTENDFAFDAGAVLDPSQVGVTFLEASDATSPGEADVGGTGIDLLPFLVQEPTPSTHSLDPADVAGVVARVDLQGPDGTVLFTLTPTAPTATATLQPGRHVLVVYSGHTLAQGLGGPQAVFLRADDTAAPGLPAATAEVAASSMKKLLSVNVCVRCDLTGADLHGRRLAGAGLMYADLSRASLAGADLHVANLQDAILINADLSRANLIGAKLRRADLTGADLTGATLDLATWTDGRQCAPGSIGACN